MATRILAGSGRVVEVERRHVVAAIATRHHVSRESVSAAGESAEKPERSRQLPVLLGLEVQPEPVGDFSERLDALLMEYVPADRGRDHEQDEEEFEHGQRAQAALFSASIRMILAEPGRR